MRTKIQVNVEITEAVAVRFKAQAAMHRVSLAHLAEVAFLRLLGLNQQQRKIALEGVKPKLQGRKLNTTPHL